jgi:hypothetical protein
MPMAAWLFPLHSDLQEATELGLLTLAEADALMTDRLMFPMAPYPIEYVPLLRKLAMLDWDLAEMTRH